MNANQGFLDDNIVSIIVPIYNAENYLEQCLESLISQTYKNLEIILVDDGSIDLSLDICKKFLLLDKRIFLYSQKNQGVSAARNLGLSKASGHYIAFVDSDDYIDKNMIKHLINLALANDADIVACGYYAFNNKAIIKKSTPLPEVEILSAQKAAIDSFSKTKYSCFLWNKLFKRSILFSEHNVLILLDTDIFYSEDRLYLLQILTNVSKFVYDSQPLYYYRENPTSASYSSMNKRYLTLLDAYDKMQLIAEKLGTEVAYEVAAFAAASGVRIFLKIVDSDFPLEPYIKRIKNKILSNFGYFIFCKNVNLRSKVCGVGILINYQLFLKIYRWYIAMKKRHKCES